MSCPVAKSRKSKHKDAKQQPAQDGPCSGPGRKKKRRPQWAVWANSVMFGWWCMGKYAAREQAERYAAKLERESSNWQPIIRPIEWKPEDKTK